MIAGPTRDRRHQILAALVAVGAHVALLGWAARTRPPREAPPWRPVAIATFRPRAPLPARAPESPPGEHTQRRAPRASRPAVAVSPPSPPPADAPPVAPVGDGTVADGTVDFTGAVAVTGTALAPARGGGSGASPPVAGPSRGSTAGAKAVALDGESWSCPWPAEAAAAQVYQQTVAIRVVVDQTGRAESVEIVADPGLGFGEAARACALRARFTPARDARGEPVRARSPAIAVRFVR